MFHTCSTRGDLSSTAGEGGGVCTTGVDDILAVGGSGLLFCTDIMSTLRLSMYLWAGTVPSIVAFAFIGGNLKSVR